MGILKKMHATISHPDERPESLALDTLFKEYYDRLVYFAWQLVKEQAQAQDIVQDAFIKYWQEKDYVAANKIAVKNYLYSTVRNASLNAIRHSKVVDDYWQHQGTNEPEELPVIEAIISSEVVAEIHLAIEALPENYRQISVMSYLDGKKNHEIAEELGMSINTVKKQKYRALELLKLKLSPELLSVLLAIEVMHMI